MRKPIEIPKSCPVCSEGLVIVNAQLFCVNKICPAVLDKQLEHFIKTLEIKGLGTKTLEKLDLTSIVDIYKLTEKEIEDKIGSSTLASKIYSQIEFSKKADLSKVLTAFGIPLIGKVASSKICSVIYKIDDIDSEACKRAGLGEKATNNLLNFLAKEFPYLRDKLPFSFKVNKQSSNIQQTVCITGKLKSFNKKSEAAEVLNNLGYIVVDSVTKTTDILIDESSGNSEKRKKAEAYGIRIVTNINDLLKESKDV